MPKDDDNFQLYPCFNGLPSESLDDHTFEVEALVAGSKDDEKQLIGPRLVRRFGGVPGKGIQERCSGQAAPFESQVKAISRRPGQTLQDFFATRNMAYGDAAKAGVGIDPSRRAYHGLTDDHINHIHGFV